MAFHKIDDLRASNKSDVIELNVGGIVLTTYLSTLTKDSGSKLAAMFEGRNVTSKDKDGRFFIDCNGKVFQYILDFFRFGTLPPPEKALEVFVLATYFKIESLSKQLKSFHAVQYRLHIESIRHAIRTDSQIERQYIAVKEKAIDKIKSLDIGPMTDKVLHIESETTESQLRHHTSDDLKRFRAREANISANIRIKADCTVNKYFKQLLAYELCQLGYGKYFDISKCHGDPPINCQAIVLLTH